MKSVICPKCQHEISTLDYVVEGTTVYNVYLEGDDIRFEENSFYEKHKVNNFECSWCGHVLFTDVKEAEKFLKGE